LILYILLSLNITIMSIFFIIIKYYIDNKINKLKYCLNNKKNKKTIQYKRRQKNSRPISTGETQPEHYCII
jgi:hypothetical protein